MDTVDQSSRVPPGFRFHPTDEELVGYYLRKKVASQKIDPDVIRDIDLYQIEPWDLIERCRIGHEEQTEWHFFSHKNKKYPTGTRTNRATLTGFWKATGRDKAVYENFRLIGLRKTLVFYSGRAPNGQKTDWIIHEYRLEPEENYSPQEDGWVVCRAFKKRSSSSGQTKYTKGCESNFYDESSRVNSSMDPLDYITSQPWSSIFSHSCMNTQELVASEKLNFVHGDQFVKLPQLESPSLRSIKKPSSMSWACSSDAYIDQENNIARGRNTNNDNSKNNKTDWRTLEKFVASQLSQEDQYRIGEGSSLSFDGKVTPELSYMFTDSAAKEDRNWRLTDF